MSLQTSVRAICTCPCRRAAFPPSSRPSLYQPPLSWRQRSRTYASVDDAPRWPNTPRPSPYDIMGMRPDDTYTKKRFYELVKLYHPDRHHDSSGPMTPSRLERYRLVVAAHDLISDPSKRSMYDSHGLGWGDHAAEPDRDAMRARDRSWRHSHGSASGNATWEDWEKWHEERWHEAHGGKGPQTQPQAGPRLSNSTFAAIVVMMCMVGAMAQTTRVEASADANREWKGLDQGMIGEDIRRRTVATAEQSSHQRVQSFLKERDNVQYGYIPGKHDSPRERDQV